MGQNGHNSWEIHQMPIKASYCDAFYNACKNDLFCGHGNFFECARVDPEAEANSKITAENRRKYLEKEALLRKTTISAPDESSAYVLGFAALWLSA
jgi:hypothetical protein